MLCTHTSWLAYIHSSLRSLPSRMQGEKKVWALFAAAAFASDQQSLHLVCMCKAMWQIRGEHTQQPQQRANKLKDTRADCDRRTDWQRNIEQATSSSPSSYARTPRATTRFFHRIYTIAVVCTSIGKRNRFSNPSLCLSFFPPCFLFSLSPSLLPLLIFPLGAIYYSCPRWSTWSQQCCCCCSSCCSCGCRQSVSCVWVYACMHTCCSCFSRTTRLLMSSIFSLLHSPT